MNTAFTNRLNAVLLCLVIRDKKVGARYYPFRRDLTESLIKSTGIQSRINTR